MTPSGIFRNFVDVEGQGFLPVPMLAPPMIEEAFGYLGRRRFVALAYGACGGTMGDLVGDSEPPIPPDLYRRMLWHPAVQPYAVAFQIEVEPPDWLEGLSISESESRMDDLESWMKRSRCLLLDRKRRRFFVDTVFEVRGWLMLRKALYTGRKKFGRLRAKTRVSAVQDLFAWLDEQTLAPLPQELVAAWESKFQEKQTIRACVGAGFRVGLKADEIGELMKDTLQSRGSRETDP